MGTIAAAALYTRIREVLEGGAVLLRGVPEGFEGMPDQTTDRATALRTLEAPRVEPTVVKQKRSASSPTTLSNVALYDIDLRVRVSRHAGLVEQLTDAARDAVRALAAEDADVIAQALGYPGNLRETAAGAPVGLVSNLLTYVESASRVRFLTADAVSIIETDHLFRGILRSSPVIA